MMWIRVSNQYVALVLGLLDILIDVVLLGLPGTLVAMSDDVMLKGREWLAAPRLLPHPPQPHEVAAAADFHDTGVKAG